MGPRRVTVEAKTACDTSRVGWLRVRRVQGRLGV